MIYINVSQLHVSQMSIAQQMRVQWIALSRDGQNHHMSMILKSKSNHLNKGDLKSKLKSFWKWFENQNPIENRMILKSS